MKTQIHKATIDVEFTDVDELRRALERVVEGIELGVTNYKGTFLQWIKHPKIEEVDMEAGFTIEDVKGKGFMFEDRAGDTYVLIESKLNNSK